MADLGSSSIIVLWARMKEHSPSSPWPQFVAAFTEGEVDSWPESYRERRAELEQWFRDLGDADEVDYFFTTWTDLPRPAFPTREEAESCV